MKIKVDKLSYKEFSEYAESTFAKPIKMALSFFIGIAVILIIISMNNEALKGAETSLWWAVGILAVLLIISNTGMSFAFKKSGLDKTSYTFLMEKEYLKITMGKLKGNLEWHYVKSLRETKSLWIMRVPNSQFIIPKRCVGEEFEDFMAGVIDNEKIKPLKYKRGISKGQLKDGEDNKDR